MTTGSAPQWRFTRALSNKTKHTHTRKETLMGLYEPPPGGSYWYWAIIEFASNQFVGVYSRQSIDRQIAPPPKCMCAVCAVKTKLLPDVLHWWFVALHLLHSHFMTPKFTLKCSRGHRLYCNTFFLAHTHRYTHVQSVSVFSDACSKKVKSLIIETCLIIQANTLRQISP